MAESLVPLLNSLERATHLTKCLPSATNEDEVIAVYNSLRDAQQNIQLFLQQQKQSVVTMDETNKSLKVADDYDDMNNNLQEMQEDQQMPGMEDEELQRLQESIQDCALQNKRRKRAHSPASIDSSYGNPAGIQYLKRQGPQGPQFKPQDHQHKFDLIYQFHG
eukprot:Gb_31041 [translate_table: standard]